MGVGRPRLDSGRKLPLPSIIFTPNAPASAWASTVHTRLRVAAGDIEVVVPSDVTVDFRGHTGAGEIDLFDVMRNGVDVTLQRLVPGAQPTSPRLVLDAEVSVGQIRVIRDEIPATLAPGVTSTAHQ